MALVAQGMTGFFGGRPRVAPSIGVFHLLVDKSPVSVTVRFDDDVQPVEIAPGNAASPSARRRLTDGDGAAAGGDFTVTLRRLAYARSGDKGNNANIGVIARRPEFAAVIREQVTTARVAAFFEQYIDGPVPAGSCRGCRR